MTESVLLLYGAHEDTPEHPFIDKMLNKRGLIQGMLADADVQLHIGYVVGDIKTDDSTPENVLVAKDPRFDRDGNITHMTLRPGSIDEHTLVLDHFVNGFRHKRPGPGGVVEEFAAGIGRDINGTVNHHRVQRFGDDKRATEDQLTMPLGLSLPSYSTETITDLYDDWGDGKVIYKPLSGALSKGVEIFNSYNELKAARSQLQQNGLLQPFVTCTEMIPNLKALHPQYEEMLTELNMDNRRVREVRMHVTVKTDETGFRTVSAVPTLRVGEPNNPIMKNWSFVPLNPDHFAEHQPEMQQAGLALGDRFADITSAPHMYFVGDMSVAVHDRLNSPRIVANDVNCRMPRLPGFETTQGDLVTPAQRNFASMLISGVRYAKQNRQIAA